MLFFPSIFYVVPFAGMRLSFQEAAEALSCAMDAVT